MTKSKIIKNGQVNPKDGVYGMDRRWRASRLEGAVKNRGTKMVRKPKRAK